MNTHAFSPEHEFILLPFVVAGVFHHVTHDFLRTLQLNDRVELEPEPGNKHDKNAVRVTVAVGTEYKMLGYVPKETAPMVGRLITNGYKLHGLLAQIHGFDMTVVIVMQKAASHGP